MIRATFTSKGRLLDDLSAYLASLQENVNATQAAVADEIAPTIVDELGYTPDKRSYPDEYPLPWTSNAQRKWYFANIAEMPYVRSSPGIGAGWIVTNDGNGKTVIANNEPGSLYVYGSLSRSNPGAHQQLFNLITGFPEAYKTVRYWGEYIADETFARIKQQFGDLGSVTTTSRAYTRL